MCVEGLGARVKVTHMISAHISLIKTQFHGPTNKDGILAQKKDKIDLDGQISLLNLQ